MKKIATIARNPINSPNMTANDAAILERITAELTERSVNVVSVGENEEIPNDTQLVCTMSRTESTLARLKKAEEQGIAVLNSTNAVENCSRRCFMEILQANAIAQPSFAVVNSAAELKKKYYPCWIKKSNGWSCHKDDICYAQTEHEATAAIEQMAAQGVKEYIQTQHYPGDVVKFYGIGDNFFHHCYPTESKFGEEKINGAPAHYSFDEAELKNIAQKAAKAIGLTIYGGDAIITPQGNIFIIDINDFPSFTAIRDIAAKEIATLIMSKIE